MAAGTTLTLGSSSTSALNNTGSISGTDDTVNIYSFGSFSNTGTFNITNSAVNLYGSYTTALLAVFDNQDDTITIDGTLTNSGTLTVGPGSALGTVVLASGGTIAGGTIIDQGSGVKFQGGTLSDVTYDGTLDLSPSSSTVYIANGLTANNLAGTGPGTINLTGVDDTIYFEGNQTFNNATINLGNTSGYYDTIYNDDTSDTGSVLTLGPNVIVNQAINETSGYVEFYSTGYTGDGIVNEGTINAQAANGSFYIEPYNFTNDGTINVSNGDKLYIEPTTFTNNGTIAISGGMVDVTTAILGTGKATINGGTLELGASSAETVTFTGPTGTFELQHSLTAPFTGEISGLTSSPTDVIDLADLAYTNEQPTYNATTNILTVTENGGSVKLQLVNYTGSGVFTASSDGNGGTQVVASVNQGNTTTINGTLTNTGKP